jgi:hypothetical protein
MGRNALCGQINHLGKVKEIEIHGQSAAKLLYASAVEKVQRLRLYQPVPSSEGKWGTSDQVMLRMKI